MDARTLARGQAIGRAVLGAGLSVAPGRVAGPWVGAPARRPAGAVLATAMGARDVGLGLGMLRALDQGHGAAAWIRAGMLADAADAIATVRARRALPGLMVPVVAAMAASSVALGAWLQRELD
jgi:hypothetical protein